MQKEHNQIIIKSNLSSSNDFLLDGLILTYIYIVFDFWVAMTIPLLYKKPPLGSIIGVVLFYCLLS